MLGRLGRLARAPFSLTKAERARREVVRGNQFLRRGELSAAMKAFTTALDIDPDNEAAWNNRGSSSRRRGSRRTPCSATTVRYESGRRTSTRGATKGSS